MLTPRQPRPVSPRHRLGLALCVVALALGMARCAHHEWLRAGADAVAALLGFAMWRLP